MSSSNCCFLTCIQVSQEAGQVVWYSHLFQNFPQFIVIHTIKQKYMFFWNSLAFSMIQWILAIWSLFPLPFLKPSCISGNSWFRYCWSLAWRILSITLLVCEMSAIVPYSLSILWHCLSLGLEWKLTFSSSMATADFSKFVCSTFTASSFRIWNSSTGIRSPPLALFVMISFFFF